MSATTTTPTSTAAASTLDADDSSSWHREGPVRLLQGGVRRNEHCVIGDDTYAPDATPTTIFVPILPPPPARCTSPSSSSIVPLVLDPDLLRSALDARIPRPAPLVWKSTDDALQPSSSTTRGLRQKRSAPSYAEDEPEPPVIVAPRAVLKKRAPALVVHDTPPPAIEQPEQHEPAPDTRTSSPCKRARRPSPTRQFKLRRHAPEPAPPTQQPVVELVVFSSRTRALVRLETLRAEPRVAPEVEHGERTPSSQRFPVSSARDEPEPDHPLPRARTPSSSPTFHVQLFTSARRDSLASTSSLASSGSTLLESAAAGERRPSTATSASSVGDGSDGREGEAQAQCGGGGG
ncbi:hypothetical protein JCM9279_007419 [Rhodotorula babjevae]